MTICTYCGEAKGTEKMANPNLDMGEEIDWKSPDSWWLVCDPCKRTIRLQMRLSMAEMLGHTDKVEKINELRKEGKSRTQAKKG